MGSTETTDRIGNTLSCGPGLACPSCLSELADQDDMTSGLCPELKGLCKSDPHGGGRPVVVEGELGESSEVDVRRDALGESRPLSVGLLPIFPPSIFLEFNDIKKT